jgi:hypothetical protein
VIRSFLARYKWHLLILLGIYAAVTFWLFFMTDAPQTVPFEYQVN